MAKKRVKAPEVIFEAPVKFGDVSLGTRTGSVGFSLDRDFCTLDRADELFVDRRLEAIVRLGGAKDGNGQAAFTEPDVEVRASFDTNGFRVGAEKLTGLRLTFMLAEVALEDASKLSGGSGRLQVLGVAEIPEKAPFVDDGPRPIIDQQQPEGAEWRSIPLPVALPQMPTGLRKKMAEAGLHTMGDLQQHVEKHGDFWAREIPGVGGATREKLEKWQEGFWAANPQYSQTT